MPQRPNPLTRGKKQQASALLQQHRLEEAKILLAQVCKTDRRDAEAWYLLGAVNHSLGSLDEAAACCRQVVDLQPGNADAHYSLGVLLQELGELENTVPHYQQALVVRPDFLEARSNLGRVFETLGRLEEAAQSYGQALNIDPKHPEVHYNLGNVLYRLGRFEEAAERFRQAIALRAGYAEAHHNLGNALLALGQADEAINCFRQAIALRPNYAEAFYNLGIALRGQNRLDDAVASYRQALALQPDYIDALNNLGLALAQLGRLDEAVTSYQRALALKPDYVDALNNLGLALTDMGRLDEAVASCQRALEIKPDHVSALNNLGFIQISQARLNEGIASYRRALALKPNDVETHMNLSLALLRMGNFERGWEEHEWRRRDSKYKQPVFPQPQWDGANLSGKAILLHAEQGLGDTLHFIRYVPLVKRRGGRVIVACQPPLVRLLASVKGVDQIIPMGTSLPDFDVYLPLPSLPWIFKTRSNSIPADVPYLLPPLEAYPQLDTLLKPAQGKKRIGIVWAGNEAHVNDHNRSCTLSWFKELAAAKKTALFSLQKGSRDLAHAQPAPDFPITDLSPYIEDFCDTAAAIMRLDLVITVDTSVAHLAGALNRPVWVLLPFVADWRWLQDREDSPWYPGMRLFRQTSPGDWAGVFARVRRALADFDPGTAA